LADLDVERVDFVAVPVQDLKRADEFYGGMLGPTPIALRVSDVDAARAPLEAEGVVFHHGTIDSGVCHLATFSDPDGNTLQLHRRYAPFGDGTTP
jgi:catechol 2,3-dioxygenase-like lactoylglutathione lyase family enzyme